MYAASIAVDDVITALGAFLAPFIPTGKIIRAQVNRVPMPNDPFIELTELLTVDLQKPWVSYDPARAVGMLHGTARIDVQIDFYAPNASEYCRAVKTALPSAWGVQQFPKNIVPLYCSDGIQAPMIDAQKQWESRWTLTASMQYNPTIEVPQDYSYALSLTPVPPVDTP